VVTKVRERLSVSKRATQIFDMDIFNMKKRIGMEVKEQRQITILNRFVTLKNWDDNVSVDIKVHKT
jgi:hypothetical protein